MSRAVAFHRAARDELVEAAACYEARRSGLGVEFIAEIDCCVALAAEQPERYAVAYEGVRRVSARRFPYSVCFRTKADRILALSIFHGRRNPVVWRRRVRQS